jgi:hypothetical protein
MAEPKGDEKELGSKTLISVKPLFDDEGRRGDNTTNVSSLEEKSQILSQRRSEVGLTASLLAISNSRCEPSTASLQ